MRVSQWCLGAMMFGKRGNRDYTSYERIVHRSLEAEINFVDTADVYSAGESEQILGAALKGRRENVILATKCFNPMGKDLNRRGGSRRWIVQAVEESLSRLDTDYIDLYQLHRLDPAVELEESLSAMDDLVRQGKIRYVGTSTARAEQIVEAHWIAERRGFDPIRCEQPPYSIFSRAIEASVLPTCQRYGMGVMTWSPLNAGWLSGKYSRDQVKPEGTRSAQNALFPQWWDWDAPAVRRKFDLLDELKKLAAKAGLSLIDLSLAFATEHPAVTSAIIGPRTEAQLEEMLAGTGTCLTSDVLDRIDELVPPGSDVDPSNSAEINLDLTRPANRRR